MVSKTLLFSTLLVMAGTLLEAAPVYADTPLGWINSSNPAAYTTNRHELEISIAGLAVNDTLDVFNYRDDLIKASGRLEGDSGDLSGTRLELNYGITRDLSVFYRRQEHALTLDLGDISSVNLIDIDDALETTAESAGFKWTFYRANLLNPDNRQSAASLELSAFRSESADFDVVLDEIYFDNLTIFFRDPQTFSVADMEDEGWKVRLIYSWPIAQLGVATIWGGYGDSKSSSAINTDTPNATIKRLIEQTFAIEETYQLAGAALHLQLTPRLGLSAGYEFIHISDNRFERDPVTPTAGLPSFLSFSAVADTDTNHTVNARLNYWITPQLSVSLTGNLYSNQFVGMLPHYNNALSASFVDTPYGFAGLEFNLKISKNP